MANLIRTLQRQSSIERDQTLTLDQWAEYFTFNGNGYGPIISGGTLSGNKEEIAANFLGYVQGAYKSNGPVFSCMVTRMLHFAEARFQFRQLRSGRPGDYFGTRELEILERPWPNATTGDLLSRAITDVDLAGNSYTVRIGDNLYRRRPDWMTIVLSADGEGQDPDEMDLMGYAYTPGGTASGNKPVFYEPDQVAHFAPIPDPEARYRGMSWLTPVIREILADQATTSHKERYFNHGATPNIIVSAVPEMPQEKFVPWTTEFRRNYEGSENAGKIMFLGGGATAQVVGANLRDITFKEVQGAGETRIAAAAGVPPIVAGFSEGLEAATYSNYAQARRRFADGTMRPLWRNIAGSLATLINVPTGSELWYDDRDIPFLAEDVKDAAEVQQAQSISIKTLVDAGYDPDSVINAVTSGDFNRLQHSGLVSVQLLPPGSRTSENGTAAPAGTSN